MKRFGSMSLCLVAAVAMVAMTVSPALAHHRDDHDGGNGEPNHQQADQQASESSSSEAQESKPSGDRAGRQNESAQQETSSTKQTSSSKGSGKSSSGGSGPQPYPSTGPEDPEGKRYDGEGAPRGQSAPSCTNDKDGNFSGTGANRHGPYDSTCDGTASKNGNGGGSAKGRPCAGCVGNADNKNPRGQYPDGNRDGNAGYECDGNNGVGRSNPAHTACKPPVTTTSLCPPGTDMAGQAPGPDGCNLVRGRIDESTPPVDEVLPRVITKIGSPASRTAPAPLAAVVKRAGAILPFTGAGDAYFVTAVGLLLIAMGAVAMRLRREES